MKQLIVTADDFGLSLGVSKGIIKAIREGVVTETCAITNSPDFIESAQLAIASGITTMGVHLNATVLNPLTDSSQLFPILSDEGTFQKTWLKETITDGIIEGLEVEFRAQIEHLLATGLTISHFNSHHGLGMFHDKLWQLLQSLATEYRVPLRNELSLLNPDDDSCMVLQQEEPLNRIINRLKASSDNILELCCHSGFSDDVLAKITSLTKVREDDLAWVTNKNVKKQLEDSFELVAYEERKLR